MIESTITTGVDDLINYLKNKDKIAVSDVAKELNTKVSTIQKWIDFLVEEKIIGIEYKFTVPYIYLNKSIEEKGKSIEITDIKQIKKEFYNKGIKRNLPVDHINRLWEEKIKNNLIKEKEFFYKYGTTKKLQEIDLLWNRFCQSIISIGNEEIID